MVNKALHYSISGTICDQKFGLKLQYAHNKNKVQFCPQMPILHIKFPKFSEGVTTEPRLWEDATPPVAYPPPSTAFVFTPV